MEALITGGAGCVGSTIASRRLDEGRADSPAWAWYERRGTVLTRLSGGGA
ncbi:hypothetical protein ABT034_26260 [Streptomyces sp. NPDC002773]